MAGVEHEMYHSETWFDLPLDSQEIVVPSRDNEFNYIELGPSHSPERSKDDEFKF